MRLLVGMLGLVLGMRLAMAAEPVNPLTPEEALKMKEGVKFTVEMEVKATSKNKGGTAVRLNSEKMAFNNGNNLTVVLNKKALDKIAAARKIDDPAAYFKGKTIIVTGAISLRQGKPEVVITDPDAIKVKEKE
jgi:DNA/RNA endonuclease YhcR with UshA esterase domain